MWIKESHSPVFVEVTMLPLPSGPPPSGTWPPPVWSQLAMHPLQKLLPSAGTSREGLSPGAVLPFLPSPLLSAVTEDCQPVCPSSAATPPGCPIPQSPSFFVVADSLTATLSLTPTPTHPALPSATLQSPYRIPRAHLSPRSVCLLGLGSENLHR